MLFSKKNTSSLKMEALDKENVNKLTDEQLFKALKTCGLNVGPITGSTRSLYEKRLKNYLEGNSTLVSDKTITSTKPTITTKTATKTVENLTSSSLLAEPASKKTAQPSTEITTSTKLANEGAKQTQSDFSSRPKNVVEHPVSRSSSLREDLIRERRNSEEIALASTKIPHLAAKTSSHLVEKPTESRPLNTLESVNREKKAVQQISSTSSITSNLQSVSYQAFSIY